MMDTLVLTREVEAEVHVEVAVGLHGTELEDLWGPEIAIRGLTCMARVAWLMKNST
ncbi:hypothetical protein [Nonomuraea sp. NPDC049784]|uniref:hypothetical protein n=1 Tax=Nonomuraea sp. NPDC049784 TaxID=3154361 RepID=UPI003405FD3F